MESIWNRLGYLFAISTIMAIGAIALLDWFLEYKINLYYFVFIQIILFIIIYIFRYLFFVKYPLLTIFIVNMCIINLCIVHWKRTDYLEVFYGIVWILIIDLIFIFRMKNDWKTTFSNRK
jgi:hypothetical protein